MKNFISYIKSVWIYGVLLLLVVTVQIIGIIYE
jgi:hypothetical protein